MLLIIFVSITLPSDWSEVELKKASIRDPCHICHKHTPLLVYTVRTSVLPAFISTDPQMSSLLHSFEDSRRLNNHQGMTWQQILIRNKPTPMICSSPPNSIPVLKNIFPPDQKIDLSWKHANSGILQLQLKITNPIIPRFCRFSQYYDRLSPGMDTLSVSRFLRVLFIFRIFPAYDGLIHSLLFP